MAALVCPKDGPRQAQDNLSKHNLTQDRPKLTQDRSKMIENACGVTGGRSPKVFPKTRDRKERGRGTRKRADLALMCVSGLVGPCLGLSRGCLGATLGHLGVVLGLSWSVLCLS